MMKADEDRILRASVSETADQRSQGAGRRASQRGAIIYTYQRSTSILGSNDERERGELIREEPQRKSETR